MPGNVRQLKNAVESAIIVATSEELELKDFPIDTEIGHSKYPIQIIDGPGTSMQVVHPDIGAIATENLAIYKTILGLILSAVRLLEPDAVYHDDIPSLIPDEDTSWLQATDTEDPAAVMRKTLDVLSTIARALNSGLMKDLYRYLFPTMNVLQRYQSEHNAFMGKMYYTEQIRDEEDAIGRVGMTMTQIEKEAIQKTLSETGGNKTEAAKILDIGVRTLHRKLKDY